MIEQVGVKWVRSGDLLEVYIYKDIHWVNRPRQTKKKKGGIEKGGKNYDEERSLAVSINYTKKQLRRKVYANIKRWPEPNGKVTNPTFLTTTFKENISDLVQANEFFTNFMKRFNYYVTDDKEAFIKYIAVPEFQKRGAVHYHCIFFNLPYIPKEKIEETWSHGFIKVEQIKELAGSVEYLLKYMKKDLARMIPKGKKRYLASRGLHNYVEARGGDLFMLELSEMKGLLDEVQIHNYSYTGEWCGDVESFVYDLSEIDLIMPHILELEERFGVHSNVNANICDTLSMPASRPKARRDKNSQLTLK